MAFAEAGMPLDWRGSGVEERGILKADGKVLVAVDPRYFRPTEVETLLGNPTKAREKLGWVPKVGFDELVKTMVQADLESTRRLVEGIGKNGCKDSGKREG